MSTSGRKYMLYRYLNPWGCTVQAYLGMRGPCKQVDNAYKPQSDPSCAMVINLLAAPPGHSKSWLGGVC